MWACVVSLFCEGVELVSELFRVTYTGLAIGFMAGFIAYFLGYAVKQSLRLFTL